MSTSKDLRLLIIGIWPGFHLFFVGFHLGEHFFFQEFLANLHFISGGSQVLSGFSHIGQHSCHRLFHLHSMAI
jgi:hypothetical protein